jgi:hypothetical protein
MWDLVTDNTVTIVFCDRFQWHRPHTKKSTKLPRVGLGFELEPTIASYNASGVKFTPPRVAYCVLKIKIFSSTLKKRSSLPTTTLAL